MTDRRSLRTDQQGSHASLAVDVPNEEIRLVDVLVIFAKHKRLIVGFPFAVAVLAAAFSFLLPNIYTATVKILPPQQAQSSASAMLNQLSNVAGLAAGVSGLKNPNDLYVGMLKSRTVADNLIQRFELVKRYGVRLTSDARNKLMQVTNIESGKDTIISIDVDDEEPVFAAQLANAYVEELFKLTSVLAVTEASQRRLFFEQQLAKAKDSLANAENTAREALQQGGLVKVDDQARAMVETTARLRAQISAKAVELGAMRTFAAESNPELRLVQQQLESLRRELARLEGADGTRASAAVSDGKGIDNLGLLRDLKYNEVLFELLARQFEMARIDEARDSGLVQVLDKAVEPDRRSKPNRRIIVMLWAVAALVAALLWVFLLESFAKTRGDPRDAPRWQALRAYLGWNRSRQ